MKKYIELQAEQRIAEGQQKWVFAYPNRSDLLIKVTSPSYRQSLATKLLGWGRYGYFLPMLRQLGEQIANQLSPQPASYLEHVYGLVDTNFGLALVVEAIRDDQGELAMNLRDLIDAGRYESELAQCLEDFLQWLAKAPVIVYDLNLGNLVYAQGRLVMIDGIGEPSRIGWRMLSSAYNGWKNRRKIKRFRFRVQRQLANPGFR